MKSAKLQTIPHKSNALDPMWGIYCANDGSKIPVIGIKVYVNKVAIMLTKCDYCKLIYGYIKTKNITEEFLKQAEKFNKGHMSLAEKYSLFNMHAWPDASETWQHVIDYTLNASIDSFRINEIRNESFNHQLIDNYLVELGYHNLDK